MIIFVKSSVLSNWCWINLPAARAVRYVRLKISGKTVLGHRFSYQLCKGKIDNDLSVLHSCDNKACMNPDHLFLGTQKDNIHDAMRKGRHSKPPKKNWPEIMKSTQHHWQKLTRESIPEIRRRLASGETQKTIAGDYGVSVKTIGNISQNTRWRHV